ncbi:ATP-binding cassette domain-containing protein [Actinomadura algeriensis]|uniref:ABC-2 type transport system ATP-binding protein n=1 Tax=Actinomadura algeriensis TaxID=1679523 RepID=A0ABR9JIY3_9ACTN|nr:ATP-binding cassette domain-containing protein [Actinomadura algeriensis]MBE1530509.1 ABC-2 type transport system ATP-binding protein [Actinomadura algeriensis]
MAHAVTAPPGAADPERAAALRVRGLVKTYPGGHRALDGIDFDVAAGEVFALLGPNGAGKSTTMKILTTLSRPDSGTATIGGVEVTRRPQDVRSLIGCVAQRSGADPAGTGRENLVLQGRLYGLSGRALGDRVDELVETVGLTEFADRVTRGYSGGTQRKLDIAMSLVHRPRLLFLDEPTTGLDPEIRAEIWQHIAGLSAAGALTIVLTTHYLEEADRLADRVAILDQGRLVTQGTPAELKDGLDGDAILVEVVDPEAAGPARRILERLDRVRGVTVDGCTVRARVDGAAMAIPDVLAALGRDGIAAASVAVARPSLDDVYLRYAGRKEGGR